MTRINRAAILAAALMASTAMTGVAQAQMSYSKAGATYSAAPQQAPVVSFTQDGQTYETYGAAPVGGATYTKGAPVVQYAPVEYVQETPTVYEAAVVPVVELDDQYAEVPTEIPEVIIEEPVDQGFIDTEIDTLIDELADEDLSYDDPVAVQVANFIRLSGGYGFANAGTFAYGTSYDTYVTAANTQDDYSADKALRGPAGSLRADVGSFFVDGGFGYYNQSASAVSESDLSGVPDNTPTHVGPVYTIVDGAQTHGTGFAFATSTAAYAYDTDDVFKTTYAVESQLTEFGGAAGYKFDFGGIGFGVGVAGRRIQGTDTVTVTQTAEDAAGTDITATNFNVADHTLNVAYAGNYVGPVVRVNFDQNLGGRLSAHVGGTAQALYGQRTLDANQVIGADTYTMTQATANGFAFGGELDAGVGFAVSDNVAISVGGFGSFLSAAPGYTAHDAALYDSGAGLGDWASMSDQSLVTYGLKGSVSLRF